MQNPNTAIKQSQLSNKQAQKIPTWELSQLKQPSQDSCDINKNPNFILFSCKNNIIKLKKRTRKIETLRSGQATNDSGFNGSMSLDKGSEIRGMDRYSACTAQPWTL